MLQQPSPSDIQRLHAYAAAALTGLLAGGRRTDSPVGHVNSDTARAAWDMAVHMVAATPDFVRLADTSSSLHPEHPAQNPEPTDDDIPF